MNELKIFIDGKLHTIIEFKDNAELAYQLYDCDPVIFH